MFLGMGHVIHKFSRAGGIETNPTTFSQRAATFASAVAHSSSATLLTRRDAAGLHGYLIIPSGSEKNNAPLHLAHTVGARADETELPTDLGDTPAIGELVYEHSPALRETQSGIDPSELPRLLAHTLPEGSWVAVSMRKPSNSERKHHTAWLSHRLGTAVPTHHSISPSAMVVSITAGGASRDEVTSLLAQVTAGLPGFDLETKVRFAPTRSRALLGLPIGIALAAATLFGIPQLPAEIASYIPSVAPTVLYGLAAAFVVAGVLALTNRIKSADTKLRAQLDDAVFPAPAKRAGKPRAPHKESVVRGTRKGPDGEKIPFEKHIAASDGDYPVAPNCFIVGPTVVVGIVSPHAGALSGTSGTRERATPPAMLANIGPMLGYNGESPAHLSAASLLFGAAIVGKPGSGKSLLTRTLFGWHCLERVHPSRKPGYPGRNNALIAFESKGDGVPKYKAWAAAMGDRVLAIDVIDPNTKAIDLFAVPGDNAARANFFTNAMRYAFGDQAIGDRSYETLVAVFTAALSINDNVLLEMKGRNEERIPLGGSPIFYAYLLLGGYSDAIGVQLAEGIRDVAVRWREREQPNLQLEQAYGAIASLYEGRTESARRSFLEAPRNKVSQLLAVDNWFSPARPKVTWDQVLGGHHSIVINTGAIATGEMLDDSQNQQMSSLILYSLQHAIRRICSGWLEQERFVTIFADELSLLTASSPEIIGWLRDQGRSYGCRPILATQRPEQLGSLLRNNFLTYSTLISFAQGDVATAAEVAANVGSGSDWTTEDIQHLEPFHVVVRSEVDQRRQPAFVVKLPNFEAEMNRYPRLQGYTTGVPA